MRELNIDKGLLNQYPKLETKKTSSGIILLYSKDELLKINRKYSHLLGLEKEEDILPHIKKYLNSMILDEKKFLLLEQKQKKIKNTIFPLGIIKYDGKLVGTILHYFKNSIFLDEYLKKYPNNFYFVLSKLLETIFELFSEYIYPTDLYCNVIVGENMIPHLIDLDDEWLKITSKKDTALESYVCESFKIFIKDFAYSFGFLKEIREEIDNVSNNYNDLKYELQKIERVRKNSN